MKVLVTGGTGTLGRLVVPRLQDAGCDVRVLSRPGREPGGDIEFVTGDLASGEGVQAAVQGAEIIVHCAGTRKGDGDKASRLVHAASRAGTRHLVYISVVGADRIPIRSGIDRLKLPPIRHRHHRQPGHLLHEQQHRLIELG